VGDAHLGIARVYPANELINELGLVSRRDNAGWCWNQFWHGQSLIQIEAARHYLSARDQTNQKHSDQ
jgi:hypothetical protein